jgi:hypothetical protein
MGAEGFGSATDPLAPDAHTYSDTLPGPTAHDEGDGRTFSGTPM